MESMTVRQTSVPDSILSRLDARDIALWVSEDIAQAADPVALAEIIRLPWRAVILERGSPALEAAILAQEDPNDFRVMRRGYPIIIDGNPADIVLPPRNLPIYRHDGDGRSGSLAAQLSRLSILNELARANPREMLVLSSETTGVPADLRALWEEGFRPLTTLVGGQATLFAETDGWRRTRASGGSIAIVEMDIDKFARDLSARYAQAHAGECVLLRMRSARGDITLVDITHVDDAQHPVLGRYELIQDQDLRPLAAEDLTAETVEGFFRDPSASWEPYAAGLPGPLDQFAWP